MKLADGTNYDRRKFSKGEYPAFVKRIRKQEDEFIKKYNANHKKQIALEKKACCQARASNKGSC